MRGFRLLTILGLLIMATSCSQQGEKTTKTAAAPSSTSDSINPAEIPIRNALMEFFGRLKEGDKTVMYENEFTYYQLEYPLGKYYELDRVKNYKYDTLKGIEIDSVKIMQDSAGVYFRVLYQNLLGEEKQRKYYRIMYYTRDRWILPYQSRIKDELEFRQRKREYDSVTAGQ